ncbi:phenylacetone monooxygenase [Venturia nashicola]|uniref:Phenylacetone monooxygenase n=1 Tax=Venturia nashicola TaxID=86259 RepID=A0A4Z1P5F1_9PEZI|nr:phenylacetone monooxygenase [Venturia nashicola]
MATAAVQQPVHVAEPSVGSSTSNPVPQEEPSFDASDILKKYEEERDKRINLRPEGLDQYKHFNTIFSKDLSDPYTPRVEREPMVIETDFLVIGGGFAGLLLGARLMEAGITNMRIIDKAESYCYMPLLEETRYIPTEKYAKGPEILEHAQRIARQFGLYEKALFHTAVSKMTWDESSSRWLVETDRGDVIRPRFLSTASGPFNLPKLPGIPGIETFKGHSFHTSRWDYDYTGGSAYGKLDKLKGKKIGIIGTGASAIQVVPQLGQAAGELYVFQRTPSSISRRDNKPTDPEWAAEMLKTPGWQGRRQDNFQKVAGGSPEGEDLVNDGWTWTARFLRARGIKSDQQAALPENMRLRELADHAHMESLRARCDEVVKDPKTANDLKPWFRAFCKRPCFHDDYLDTFNRPNVHLVHTDGRGVDSIDETGIIANGQHYDLDCIIYSTGYEYGTAYTRRSNFSITGRNGLTIDEKWSEGEFTFHGMFINQFPNMFLISYLQVGTSTNGIHTIIRQTKHVASIVKTFKERRIKTFECTKEAEEEWTDGIVQGQTGLGAFLKCTPGYYTKEGTLTESIKSKRGGPYMGGSLAFCKLLEAWRDEGSMKGLECVEDAEAWK